MLCILYLINNNKYLRNRGVLVCVMSFHILWNMQDDIHTHHHHKFHKISNKNTNKSLQIL